MGEYQHFGASHSNDDLAMKKAILRRKKKLAAQQVKPQQRTSVGRPGEIRFTVDPHRAKRRKTSPKVAVKTYGVPWWIKVSWLALAALTLRLVFMDRGVMDYYQMNRLLEDKKRELVSIHEDNSKLLKEIKRIDRDPQYQKKLAREHLGVIAPDEFLVLFAKEQVSTSR